MKQKVTLMQYIFLIHGTQVGIGLMALPRKLAEKGGTDGWMAIPIGWGLSTLVSLGILQVMKRHPNQTIVDVLPRYFGKWLAKIGIVLISLYMAFYAYTILDRAVLYIKEWILQQTPTFQIFFLFLIPTFLIVRKGFQVIGRYTVLIFFLSSWLLFLLLVPLKDAHGVFLLPFFKEGVSPILQSVPATIFPFMGFEISFFLYPFLTKKKWAPAGIVIANTLSMLIYLYITLLCFVFFSPNGITQYYDPTLVLLQVIQLPFLERFDIVVLAVYLFIVSTTWLPLLWCSVFSVNSLYHGHQYYKPVMGLLVIFLAVTFFVNPSYNDNDKLIQLLTKAGLIFAYAFPVFLWLYTSVFNRIQRRSYP